MDLKHDKKKSMFSFILSQTSRFALFPHNCLRVAPTVRGRYRTARLQNERNENRKWVGETDEGVVFEAR